MSVLVGTSPMSVHLTRTLLILVLSEMLSELRLLDMLQPSVYLVGFLLMMSDQIEY